MFLSGIKKIRGYKQKEDRPNGKLDRAKELNTFFNRFSSGTSSALSSLQTSHPPLTKSFPVTPQMLYLPLWQYSLLLLHVCLQLNQGILVLPLPPPSTCVSQEDR
ncbi:hypothetical protein AMECASPLE_007629 [Ameca splendens]|uniref:Uncharacterized protein n=1 Tax=Ameca splendens TaxID=208324 RepID=A0ABV0ZA75_9TELE